MKEKGIKTYIQQGEEEKGKDREGGQTRERACREWKSLRVPQVLIAEAKDVSNPPFHKIRTRGTEKRGMEYGLDLAVGSSYHRSLHLEQGLRKIQGLCRTADCDLIAKQFCLLPPPSQEEVTGRGGKEQISAKGEEELKKIIPPKAMGQFVLQQSLDLCRRQEPQETAGNDNPGMEDTGKERDRERGLDEVQFDLLLLPKILQQAPGPGRKLLGFLKGGLFHHPVEVPPGLAVAIEAAEKGKPDEEEGTDQEGTKDEARRETGG